VAEYDDLIAAGREQLRRRHIEDALASFDIALQLCPEAAAAHYLRGEALFLQRRVDEALRCHDMALRGEIERDVAARGEAMSGMIPGDFAWMCHMLRGDFESAWRLADRDLVLRRGNGIAVDSWPRHMRPVWDGAALDGRHVLVRCYHGLGDTIQFIRYVPLLAQRAASVCVEVQPELLDLVSEVPGIDHLCGLPEDWEHDCRQLGCDMEIDARRSTRSPRWCRIYGRSRRKSQPRAAGWGPWRGGAGSGCAGRPARGSRSGRCHPMSWLRSRRCPMSRSSACSAARLMRAGALRRRARRLLRK
jgi:hypothetical protein